MKLYTAPAPNPMRVTMFLAEKGLDIPIEPVAIMQGETRTPEFLKINSLGEVPVLELDDGTRICESVAICRYLEALHPDPALFGTNDVEKAEIEMWNRRMEQHIMNVIGAVGLHTIEFFKDKIEQIPEFADSQRRLMVKKWAWLEGELSDGRPYVAGDTFSVADITGVAALVVHDYVQQKVPASLTRTKAWEARVRARGSWPMQAAA